MHIPDGYLSPSTCAVTFILAAPVWFLAFSRLKKVLHTRAVPLMAVFSAFSFVIMMFNLPLPGGTTGHAVGMGLITVVLGPWASVVCISIALLIQALFFGDGGVTAFGANSLNMAIIGSFVAHWVYLLLAGRSEASSGRRMVAAAIAGYVAINVSAFFAAVEFGIQPMLFHDATGTPLYAPYPLSVSIPAMMLGHLTFAGLAELVVTGGVLAYLQRAQPELLQRQILAEAGRGGWSVARKLWLGVAVLMICSPLGLLAAGTAWGEWGVEDFGSPQARVQMSAASGHAAPPARAPAGLTRLAGIWRAPIPDYAPGFMHSERFGYILSAVFGGGLVLLVWLIVSVILSARTGRNSRSA